MKLVFFKRHIVIEQSVLIYRNKNVPAVEYLSYFYADLVKKGLKTVVYTHVSVYIYLFIYLRMISSGNKKILKNTFYLVGAVIVYVKHDEQQVVFIVRLTTAIIYAAPLITLPRPPLRSSLRQMSPVIAAVRSHRSPRRINTERISYGHRGRDYRRTFDPNSGPGNATVTLGDTKSCTLDGGTAGTSNGRIVSETS